MKYILCRVGGEHIGTKGDGGGGNNRNHKTYKATVKMSPPTIQYPVLYKPDALPVTKTNSVKALKGKLHSNMQ